MPDTPVGMSSTQQQGATASLVISTYNRPRALDLVFEGIWNQSVWPDQIVIGDDGSGPETVEIIIRWSQRGLPIEHCWHPDEGYRKTIIMNQAFSRVRHPITIFLDGDCIPGPSFVYDHLRLSEQGHVLAGPRILASAHYTSALESKIDRPLFVDSWARKLMRRSVGQINRLAPLVCLPDGGWRRRQPKKWELVRGCNFSVETRAVWAVDGFEESLYGWGPDDSDIAVRLIHKGQKIKSGRFACPVLHLWHREESRDGLAKNREYLQTAMVEKRIQSVRGLSSHGLSCPRELG